MKENVYLYGERFDGLKAGIYEHYKGGLYQVLGVGELSDNAILNRWPEIIHEKYMVVYVSLTGANLPGPRMRVRSLLEFVQHTHWPDGTTGPRFKFVGFQL